MGNPFGWLHKHRDANQAQKWKLKQQKQEDEFQIDLLQVKMGQVPESEAKTLGRQHLISDALGDVTKLGDTAMTVFGKGKGSSSGGGGGYPSSSSAMGISPIVIVGVVAVAGAIFIFSSKKKS